MSNLKWPLIWKNIKLDIINKQLILLELVYRFGLKHIILKKAQMRMITLLSFRLWATKIVCRQLDCGTFVMAKSVSIKEKIKIVKSLKNVLTVSSTINHIKWNKINLNVIQFLFQLILSPLFERWENNSLKRLTKRLKTKLISYKKVKNFYSISYSVISINQTILCKSVLNMFLIFNSYKQFLNKWFMFYHFYKFKLNKFFKISILFLFFKLILNKFESFIWKKLLIVSIKHNAIKHKFFLCKHSLQIKDLVLISGYPTFLKMDLICSFNCFNALCNNSFFINNFILAEISKFFKGKGIYLVLRKSKICVSKTLIFTFFWWIGTWDKNKNQFIWKLRPNKLFSLKKILKQLFFKNLSLRSYKLVVILNCIFKYWYHIFKLNSFYNDFKQLDNFLFKLCRRWVFKKHYKQISKVILNFYFKYKNKFLFFKHKFNGIIHSKSENLKLKKRYIYAMRFQSLTLLN